MDILMLPRSRKPKTASKQSSPRLNNFETKVDNGGFHLKTNRGDVTGYLCLWSIRNFSLFKYGESKGFQDKDCFSYSVHLSVDQKADQVIIRINSQHNSKHHYNCNVTISTYLGTVLFHNTLVNNREASRTYNPFYDNVILKDENLQKLKQLPNDTLVLTYRIKHSGIHITPSSSFNTLANNSEYLKSLQADLKEYPNASLKEKVRLCVGEETEIVNKAVLCVRSPVFAKMFENDMREVKDNTVAITDIKMPTLRALVSFLYSGLVQDCDVDFLFDLYYSADKYQITDLQLACTGLILGKVSLNNIFRVLKLSLLHNDELLKSAAMTLICANFETIAFRSGWKNFMHDDPETGLMVPTFFEF